MATVKKSTTRTKKSKKLKKLPGTWESITQISYYGMLWRVVVFIGVYLALVTLYLAQEGLSPLGDTGFMQSTFEGLLIFIFAFAVYDGLCTTVVRRYPWHVRGDKVVQLGIEAAVAVWFLLGGAVAFATLTGSAVVDVSNTLDYTLFWLLVIAAAWPPLRVFIGVSHQAMASAGKKK